MVPDETTILRFRHLLEKYGLTKGIFEEIAGLLEDVDANLGVTGKSRLLLL